jgi:hypothetical protein
MDVLEGLFQLIALLFRCAFVLFDVLDVLQVLYGIVNFIADLLSRLIASIPWFRCKPEPKTEMQALADRYKRKRHISAASK